MPCASRARSRADLSGIVAGADHRRRGGHRRRLHVDGDQTAPPTRDPRRFERSGPRSTRSAKERPSAPGRSARGIPQLPPAAPLARRRKPGVGPGASCSTAPPTFRISEGRITVRQANRRLPIHPDLHSCVGLRSCTWNSISSAMSARAERANGRKATDEGHRPTRIGAAATACA